MEDRREIGGGLRIGRGGIGRVASWLLGVNPLTLLGLLTGGG